MIQPFCAAGEGMLGSLGIFPNGASVLLHSAWRLDMFSTTSGCLGATSFSSRGSFTRSKSCHLSVLYFLYKRQFLQRTAIR